MPKMCSKRGLKPHEVDVLIKTRLLTTSGPGGTVFEHQHHHAVLRGRFNHFTLFEYTGAKREISFEATSKCAAVGKAASFLTGWWR